MILYHGSNTIIHTPDLAYSKPYKDFGKGFYLSADKHQAERMAEQRWAQTLEGAPAVTQVLFDETNLQSPSVQVKIFETYSVEWVEFVLRNRDMRIPQPTHSYDIVYGPIADDSVTFQLRRYFAESITIEELLNELKYSKGITFQYYFGTQKALNLLQKLCY